MGPLSSRLLSTLHTGATPYRVTITLTTATTTPVARPNNFCFKVCFGLVWLESNPKIYESNQGSQVGKAGWVQITNKSYREKLLLMEADTDQGA